MIERPKIEVPDAEWWAALEVVRAAKALRSGLELDTLAKLWSGIDDFDKCCEHQPASQKRRKGVAE